MTKLQKLSIAALAASVSMLPLFAVAQAQEAPAGASEAAAQQPIGPLTGEVTVGVGGLTGTNSDFAKYNGEEHAGVAVLGGWNLRDRDVWDSGGTRYLSFTGDNVNFGFGTYAPEAAVNLKVGQQGHWGLNATYDAMTYDASNHFTSILTPSGALVPGFLNALAANGAFVNNSATPNIGSFVFYGPTLAGAPNPTATNGTGIRGVTGAPAGTSSGSHAVGNANSAYIFGPQNEQTFQIGTRRDKVGLDGSYQLGSWLIKAGITHEHKEGTLEQAMTTGGSNTGMVAFPMPINYDTDNYSVSAAYNTRQFQAALTYEFSNFIDHNSSGYQFEGWNFTEVYDPIAKTYTSYEYNGVYGLPPNNQAHNFTAQVGYNLTPATRLNGTFVWGLQLQNDPLTAPTLNQYTLNVGGVAGPTHNAYGNAAAPFYLNPGSLGGVVQTFFGNVTATSRDILGLDLKGAYTVDIRDTQTPSYWIVGVSGDAATNVQGVKYRESVPESWTKQKVVLSAGYHFMPESQVIVGYTFQDDQRTNAITHHAQDNQESIKVQSSGFMPNTTGSLSYVHSDRSASAPDYSLWTIEIASDCSANNATAIFAPGVPLTTMKTGLSNLGCQQIPFYEAARTQDMVTGMVTDTFGDNTSLSLYGKYTNNNYHDPAVNYLSATGLPAVGVNNDYSITIGPDLNYRVTKDFDVHLFYTYLRTYRAMRALNSNGSTTLADQYGESTTYDIHTAGISATRQFSPKLKVGLDYVFSYGNLGFAQSGTWDTGYAGDPQLNVRSTDNTLRLHASYDYSANLAIYLAYQFDSLDMNDWSKVTNAYQVLTGDVPPQYNVSTVIAALKFKF
jgi:MtrB/PioB family decaheme-associated outer membrane protein